MDRICLFQVNSAEDFKIKERGVLTNRNNLPKAQTNIIKLHLQEFYR